MPLQNTGTNGRGKPFDKIVGSTKKSFSSREQTGSGNCTGNLTNHVSSRKVHKEVRENISAKRYAFLILVVFMVLFSSFSYAAEASKIVFGLASPPERLIPITLKNPQTSPISMQIFEGLVDLNEDGKVIPRLIENWETADYKTWIFHVRKGVYFHRSPIFENGKREVTADDIIYSLTRFSLPEAFPSFLLTDSIMGAREYNQGKAASVAGLKRIDSHTIQVELLRPQRFFLNCISTAFICVFPRESEKKEFSDEIGLTIAVGTGPYLLESMTENEVVLKRNGQYWDKENMPQLEKLVFRIVKNDQARFANLQRGKIDMMVLPNTLFPAVFDSDGILKKGLKDYKVKVAPTFNSHFIGINVKLVPDVNLRRAMFWATDREQMVKAILFGYGDVTGGTIPPGMNGYQPPFGNVFDLKRAQEFLKKSSYKGKPLEFLVHNIGNSEQIGQIFQAQMARIGINVELKKLDYNSVINRMIKGEAPLFSMFMEYVFSSPEPILMSLFPTSKIPVPNFFQFSNTSVDGMIERLYDLKDEKEAVKFCADIEAKIMEDVPAIFLYRQKYVILHPHNLQGLELSGNNHYFLEKLRFTQ